MTTTVQGDLIVPEIFAGEIQKKMGDISLIGLATVEPFTGSAGNYNVTKQAYLGDAVILGEAQQVPYSKIEQTKVPVTFHKIVQGVKVTDEADLNGLGDVVEDSAISIAETLDGGVDALLYSVLSEAKVTKVVSEVSKNTVLEVFKAMKGFKNKKNRIVVDSVNYASIQQVYKTTTDADVFDQIAGTEIFVSDRVQSDEFFIIQEGGLKLKYSKLPQVEKGRDLDFFLTKVVGSVVAGAWITDDAKVIKVSIVPEIEDVEV